MIIADVMHIVCQENEFWLGLIFDVKSTEENCNLTHKWVVVRLDIKSTEENCNLTHLS